MKNLRQTIFGTLLVLTFAFFVNAQSNWVGEYEFGEDGGKTAGGSAIYIAHTIEITEKDGKLDAHIYSQGFQTSRDIFADVKVAGDKIEFYFREKGEDQYTSIYNQGDLLLTLEKKESDGETKFLTYWDAFTPMLDSNEKSGEVYFVKITEKSKTKSRNEAEWMRIESDDKRFSIAFPTDSIINAENNDKITDYKIDGYKDGVSMHLSIYGKKFDQGNLKRMILSNPRQATDFKIGDFTIRKIDGDNFEKFSQTYYITSKKKYYRLYVTSDSAANSQVSSFLMSIKLDDKPIFKNTEDDLRTEKTISFKDLKSSPEVIEAIKRKPQQQDRNIRYEIKSYESTYNINDEKNYSRKAIVIEQARPEFPSSAKSLSGKFEVSMNVELLANGQVGDITIIQSPTDAFANQCCVDAVKKLKFIPAQINGQNVDSFKIIRYNFQTFTTFYSF